MANIRISAYTDKLSAKAGDTLQVMASADATSTLRAQLVRLIHGDEHPDGPGYIEQVVASAIDRDWPSESSTSKRAISCAWPTRTASSLPRARSRCMPIFFRPRRRRTQTLLGRWSVDGTSGFALGINPTGRLDSGWVTARGPTRWRPK